MVQKKNHNISEIFNTSKLSLKSLFYVDRTSLNNGKLEINKSPSQACVDIRSILDEVCSQNRLYMWTNF